MDVNVIGVGITGFATAEVLRRLGNEVRVHDVNPARQRELEGLGFSRLDTDKGEVTFFCVPEWNLKDALDSARQEGIWVARSSTKPGHVQALQEGLDHHIVHLPEFLREATALWDALTPNHIVIGECCQEHGAVIERLFAPLLAPIIRTDSTTTEMLKLVANAYLSTLISFWNEVHAICDRAGVNSTVVGKIASMDPRISTYGAVMHGKPFAGACLPKDLNSLIAAARASSVEPLLLESVRQVNDLAVASRNGTGITQLEDMKRIG